MAFYVLVSVTPYWERRVMKKGVRGVRGALSAMQSKELGGTNQLSDENPTRRNVPTLCKVNPIVLLTDVEWKRVPCPA